jgi:hypothetical protein
MRLASTIALVVSVSLGKTQAIFDPPLQNFTQKLDHSSSKNITFQQRYQVDARHFVSGGPILFHQGEQIPLPPLAEHVFSDYAPKLGALVVALEHRYCGQSFPNGLSSKTNITNEQYAPLTLDNILQDSVEFINFIRATVPGAENSKVIHSSGGWFPPFSMLLPAAT